MRWYFPDPDATDEQAARRETLQKIDAWWREFAAQADRLREVFSTRDQEGMEELPQWIADHLLPVHPCLMWEFGPTVDGRDRLSITPESRHDLRPLVRMILRRAPDLPEWLFLGHRPILDPGSALSTTAARTGVELNGLRVLARPGELHLVDLMFEVSPRGEQAHQAVFVGTEYLLGEMVLDRWIGLIEVEDALPAEGVPVPVAELPAAVKAIMAAVLADLPEEPYHRLPRPEGGAILTLQPQPADEGGDFPGYTDVLTGRSSWPDLWTATHAPAFDSARYSRRAEKFAYVKIDGHEWTGHGDTTARGVIEDVLDDGLRSAGLGCTFGGATGLRYSYVDLAIGNVREAADCVRELLAEHALPERTWLLFFDRELEAEWIGLRPGSPPPPMRDFEAEE